MGHARTTAGAGGGSGLLKVGRVLQAVGQQGGRELDAHTACAGWAHPGKAPGTEPSPGRFAEAWGNPGALTLPGPLHSAATFHLRFPWAKSVLCAPPGLRDAGGLRAAWPREGLS